MNTETHLAVGWILAHLGGGHQTRGFRAAVTFAAVAPDLDALSYVLGRVAYGHIHHALGHNVFFSLAVTAAAIGFCRHSRWWKIFLFTQLAFYSHYFGDYFFTKFPLVFWWPISDREYLGPWRFGLDHPVNNALSYLSFMVFIVMAMIYRRTPIEIISPALDQRIVNLFRPQPLACHICGGRANERCVECSEPACLRHGRLTRRFAVRCSRCAAGQRARNPSGA